MDDRDGTATSGFGRHVPDQDAVGYARETAVGDEGDILAETPPLELDGEHDHLGHAGFSDGSNVAHDDDIAVRDLAGADRVHGVTFAFEHSGGAGEAAVVQGLATELEHTTLGCQVAGEHGDVIVGWGDRCSGRQHDVLVAEFVERWHVGQVLGHGFAGDRHRVAMK